MRILNLLAAVGGCAALTACAAISGDPQAREREAFAQELQGRVAGAAHSCVSGTSTTSLNIIDPQTLAYRSGGTIYVNRLRAACPGLRPSATLIVESRAGQYCRGDFVRALEPGSSIPGPICPLGDFIPYRSPPRRD
jgi:hypothetical protein